jgi:hypothetical protein
MPNALRLTIVALLAGPARLNRLTRVRRSGSRRWTDGSLTTPLGKASRQALSEGVKALLASMPTMRWSARVVDVRSGVVDLGAAAADGLRPGLELEVYEVGEALTEPGTGQSLGAPETFLGIVRVETVLERFGTASVMSGEGFGRGHVVRLKGATPR